jgi:hypothetical protein
MQNVPPQAPSAKRKIESATATPSPLPVNPDGIPAELKVRNQWVAWKYVWKVGKAGKGKWRKVPVNPRTGRNAKPNDPMTWGSFEDALARYQSDHLDGIGYMFTEDDPCCGVDLDDCRDPDTGMITEWGRILIAKLDTYTEVSPSQTGAKAFVRAKKPGDECSKEYQSGKVEIFEKVRFFALTGHHLDGTPVTINDRQAQLEEVYFEVFGRPGTPTETKDGEGPATLFQTEAQETEEELPVELAAELDRLVSECANPRDGDRSKADFSLCCWAIRHDVGRDLIFRRLSAVGKTAERGQKYFDDTWEAAEAEVSKHPAPSPNGKPAPSAKGRSQTPLKSHALGDLILQPERPRRTPSGRLSVFLRVTRQDGEGVDRLTLTEAVSNRREVIKALNHLAPGADAQAAVGKILDESAAHVDQEQAAGKQGPTIAEILAEKVPPKFDLIFRTDRGAYSQKRGAEVTSADFARYLPKWLRQACQQAVDAPDHPLTLFKTIKAELESLFSTLLEKLPTETQANYGPTSPAAQRFKHELEKVLTYPTTFEVEKASLNTPATAPTASKTNIIERIRDQHKEFLKGATSPASRGGWRKVQKAYDCWWKPIVVNGKPEVLIGLRHRIAYQTQAAKSLPGVYDQKTFRHQCEQSGLLLKSRKVRGRLTGGNRLVVLSRKFIRELMAEPV